MNGTKMTEARIRVMARQKARNDLERAAGEFVRAETQLEAVAGEPDISCQRAQVARSRRRLRVMARRMAEIEAVTS